MPALKPLKIKAEDFHSLSIPDSPPASHKQCVMTAPLITARRGAASEYADTVNQNGSRPRVQSMGTGLCCNSINYHLMPLSQSCVGSPSVNNSPVVMRHNPPLSALWLSKLTVTMSLCHLTATQMDFGFGQSWKAFIKANFSLILVPVA